MYCVRPQPFLAGHRAGKRVCGVCGCKLSEPEFCAVSWCMVQFSPSQVRSLAQNAENLLQHRPLLCALRLWARSCRLGNMATERLLSLVRRSAPNRCTVERVLGAGYLAQLETRHKSAGGACVRTLTRKQLFSIGAPIQASNGPAFEGQAGCVWPSQAADPSLRCVGEQAVGRIAG